VIIKVMSRLTDDECKPHFDALTSALPKSMRKKCRVIRNRKLRVKEGASVKIEREWSSKPYFMKVSFPWEFHVKVKCWRQLKATGKFSYDKVAAHIVKVTNEHNALLARRALGNVVAEERIEVLKDRFDRDPMLSALGLEIQSDPTNHTETGAVDVVISPGSDYENWVQSNVVYNGEGFSGEIEFESITPEQLVAIQVVLQADRLSVLDLITLADDSILGPIIHKMTEDLEGRTGGDDDP
jgi:hypothetical protein